MTIASTCAGERPIAAQHLTTGDTKKTPPGRKIIAEANAELTPEAR